MINKIELLEHLHTKLVLKNKNLQAQEIMQLLTQEQISSEKHKRPHSYNLDGPILK